MKRTWNLISRCLLGLFVAISATACSTAGNPADEKHASSAAKADGPPTELTIALDWYPNAVHSFLYAAEEQGYFKEEHLNVHLQMPSDSNDPLKMAAAGKVDAAISYQPQVVQARAEDVPVVSIAALVRHPLNVIMTRKDSGIQSPKELAGKNIGYPSMPLDESIVRNMVKAAGGDDTGLKFTDIGFDIIPALTAKKVDAVVGGYINHEQLLLEKNGVAVNAFKPTDFGVPDYYELVLATGNDTLKNKRKELAAFLRAAAKGQKWVTSHKAEAIKLLMAKQSKEFPLDEEVEKQSLDILLPLMDPGDEAFGYQKKESWQTLIDWMKKENLISKEVSVKEVMANLLIKLKKS